MEIVGIVVIVVLLAAGVVVWWALQRGSEAPAVVKREDRLDTIAGWPPTSTRILSVGERLAYGTLSNAMPGYMVLAQVPISRFTRVPMRNSYAEWTRRIGNHCADLLVCDMASHVIGVVQVQPATGENNERAKRRLERMRRVLKAEGIPLFIWTEGNFPDVATARDALLPASRAVAAAAADRAERGEGTPASPGTGADDGARDAPPATWYDDLDTGHAQLDHAPPAPGTR